MNTNNSTAPHLLGADIFIQTALPIFKAAERKMSPQDLAFMYAGYMGAILGAMTAAFGHEYTGEMATRMLASFQYQDITQEQGTLQ